MSINGNVIRANVFKWDNLTSISLLLENGKNDS